MKKCITSLFARTAGSMSKKQRWTALIVLAVSLFVVMMDVTILFLALPEMIRDLNPTATQQLWIVDVYALILAGLLIPMSALADRWGRKKILLAGFALFGLVSTGVIFAETASYVVALRALLGVAGAMIMPTTLSMIRTIFTDAKERATALAIWAGVSGLGAAAGPLVGGALLEQASWHSAFLINVPIALLAVAIGVFLLPEGKNPKPPRWDMVATVLVIGGMSGLVWSIKEFAKVGAGSGMAWAILIGAVALLAAFIMRSLRQKNPMLEVRLFKRTPFTASVLAAFFSMFAMIAMMLLVSQWLQAIAAWPPLKSGLALLPMALGSIVVSPLAPTLAQKLGARNVLAGGLLTSGVGMLLIFAISPLTYPILGGALFLLGAGMASLAVASAIIMSSTPQEKAGSAAAIEESVYELGSVFGIAIIGSISAAMYRQSLEVESFAAQGIVGEAATVANESVVGALEIASQLHLTELATTATAAFNDSISIASAIGAGIIILAAVTVFMLLPKTLDITTQHE